MSEKGTAEIKATLAQIMAMLVRMEGRQDAMANDLAEVKARVVIMPQPPEFYELRGRVEEISRRLPTTLAYPQPAQRQS